MTPTRRGFLTLAAGAVGAALVGCAGGRAPDSFAPLAAAVPAGGEQGPGTPDTAPAFDLHKPVRPEGRWARTLLPDTPWATNLMVSDSGIQGPTVLVLGGVHGNEPGGFLAAEQVADWWPASGSLAVVPRANVRATWALERTFPELGDLNRLYPGNPEGLPMAQMAASIVELARELRVDFVLDMHESWAFYAERAQNGTAFLGQTITAGQGPQSAWIAESLCEQVNMYITVERDRLLTRDQAALPGQTPPPNTNPQRGSSSSLGFGRHVNGATPILVEMGQMNQTVARRVELQLLVARALLGLYGMA